MADSADKKPRIHPVILSGGSGTRLWPVSRSLYPKQLLPLVSDQPMTPVGIKTAESATRVDDKFVRDHLRIGIDSLKQLINNGLTVKHLKF